MPSKITIGGASGFWGDAMMATPQLLEVDGLDYLVYDYLAEITMSIMARARAQNPDMGYATDFVSAVLKPNLPAIAAKGVKILSNAGGVNPLACAKSVRALLDEYGLDLKIGVVLGDDLLALANELARAGYVEMFSKTGFPDPKNLASVNAYLGGFPIASALDAGADIVITGRGVDSAVSLGACIHEFGWKPTDYDLLAGGSLAGHIIECGAQATGGNFTDWRQVAENIDTIGYPIVEIEADGNFVITKPKGSGGLVSVGTVSEQMLYEIGDPKAYQLPDVICDFTPTKISQLAENRAQVAQTVGYPPSDKYKVSATFFDGFRAGHLMCFIGSGAEEKAQAFARAVFKRCRSLFRGMNVPDFAETSVELIGAESQYGKARKSAPSREVVLKLAVRHEDAKCVGIMLKEATGLALATPPGLSIFAGARPKPSPVLRLFSFLIPKNEVKITVLIDDKEIEYTPPEAAKSVDTKAAGVATPIAPAKPPKVMGENRLEVPLETLAWGRSGDKGNTANIGIIARKSEYLPYIWDALDEEAVYTRFAHFVENKGCVARYFLAGSHAINFVLNDALGGGGVASLRNDPQAKAYAQILLDHPIRVPESLVDFQNKRKAT